MKYESLRHNYLCRWCALPTVALLGLVALLGSLLCPSMGVAKLLVYDSFEYAVDEPLQGQAGGTGFWDGPWIDLAGSPEGANGGNMVAGSLEYTDANGNQLVTGGGHVISNTSSAGRVIDTASIDPSLTVNVAEPGEDPVIRLGKDNTTIWASFKYMSPNQPGERSWGGLSLADGDYVGDGTPVDLGDGTAIRPYGMRGDFGGESGDSGFFAMSPHRNDFTNIETDAPVDEESLVVLRFDFFEDTGDEDGAD